MLQSMALELKKERLPELTHSIQRYLEEEMEIEEVGELKARLLIDYIFKEIAPIAYNQGVQDAERYLRLRLEEMSGSCFEAEMTYWTH